MNLISETMTKQKRPAAGQIPLPVKPLIITNQKESIMSLRTYSYKVKGFYQTILVKMKKDDAENVKRDLSMVADIRRYRRELTGVVDQDERQSTLYSPFSAPVDLADEAGFQQEMAQLLESLPIRITYQNWPQILQTIQDIFER